MASQTATSMDAVEIAEFLAARETGVLSMARDGDSYAIPVSYAFEEASQDLFFRFGYGPDSQKREFLETGDRASFVVYDRADDGWQSVIARGPLAVLSEDSLESTVVEAVRELQIPYFTVHEQSASDLEFNVVRMAVDSLDGVAEG